MSSSLFCEYRNTEISQFYLGFALQAKGVWDIRKRHSACFHSCSGDRQALPRVLLVMTAPWVPVSHLSDEAVEGDKHFSLFLPQDSDVTLWLQQQHSLFLYFAHNLMEFFILPKISPSSWRKGEKPSFFKCLFMQLVCDHNLLHHWHLVLSFDMRRERKENKQEIRNETSLIMMSFFLSPSLGFFPSQGMTCGSCHLECLTGTLH